MTFSELQKHKIYYVKQYKKEYIVDMTTTFFIRLGDNSFECRPFAFYQDTYREATLEECIWMKECIKQNKYVPRNNPFIYELY